MKPLLCLICSASFALCEEPVDLSGDIVVSEGAITWEQAFDPWVIVCDDRGKFSFTDNNGTPMLWQSDTRKEAEERMAALKLWIAEGMPTTPVHWKLCPE